MCQELRNGPGVGKCPAPGEHKIFKCPTPGTDKAGKCRAVARGGGGGGGGLGAAGIDWCSTKLSSTSPYCQPTKWENEVSKKFIISLCLSRDWEGIEDFNLNGTSRLWSTRVKCPQILNNWVFYINRDWVVKDILLTLNIPITHDYLKRNSVFLQPKQTEFCCLYKQMQPTRTTNHSARTNWETRMHSNLLERREKYDYLLATSSFRLVQNVAVV